MSITRQICVSEHAIAARVHSTHADHASYTFEDSRRVAVQARHGQLVALKHSMFRKTAPSASTCKMDAERGQAA